ncbi:fumarylacetoacetate hydrolase family protein [Arenicella xantha]|uniref:Fumarylacetoacetate (FAA) hydrolase n=1 Tax=Arenicella xantha TaxID=644221 RepID=A0A395JFX4_9GAMM|nr:fumarylacetoacetate hydrolase family protein [Arenicella xantha]RBP47182.1 fumarylacetoacetate (FAA) hydrolase [Arenicella xantha]
MKLATLHDGSRDGRLVIVSTDLSRAVHAGDCAPTMQVAIERWDNVVGELQQRYVALNKNQLEDAFDFDVSQAMAPLPRAWQWLDGSCFLNHGELMQKAFHLDPIADADTIPLMYQGAGDDFLGSRDDIRLPSEAHGIDFEGEFAVLVDEVSMGCSTAQAMEHVKLILQLNDISLRALAPREMKTGFGFVQSKATTSFAPVAVTPDELGAAWSNARINLPLKVEWNGKWFGHPHGGEMNFGFDELIAHAALTRKLSAGTLIGSGTVSNADRAAGSACISERRAIEMIEHGAPKTEFMKFGDSIRMQALLPDDAELFGSIDQKVVNASIK